MISAMFKQSPPFRKLYMKEGVVPVPPDDYTCLPSPKPPITVRQLWIYLWIDGDIERWLCFSILGFIVHFFIPLSLWTAVSPFPIFLCVASTASLCIAVINLYKKLRRHK
jgi:hypothetical protein